MEHCHVCKAGKEKIVVSFDGSVLPCEAFKGKKKWFTLGNIYQDTIEECIERAKSHRMLNVLKAITNQASSLTLDDIVESDIDMIKQIIEDKSEDGYDR